MKILVVDDEALIRNVVKEYLEAEHFKVDEAGDGDEAIKLVNNKDYDLIVLDIMMPKKDGFQTMKEIKMEESPYFFLLFRSNRRFANFWRYYC